MSDGVDEFLNGPSTAADEAAPAPEVKQGEPAAEAPQEQPREGNGRFAGPKGEEPSAEAAPASGASPAPSEDPKLDHPALLGERRRRQEAERRLEELESQLSAQVPRQPVSGPAEGPPDRFEDPDGYDAWLVQTVSQRARADAVAAMQEERIMLSADTARAKYPDWAEKATAFADLARQNPALEKTLRSHSNPAEFAYTTAKMHLELQQHGSLEALIAARVAEEMKRAQPAPSPSPAPSIPESLAGSQSARATAAPAGPPSLDDILNPPPR